MSTRQREIVDFDGLRTYFFPNLALYALNNDELLTMRPEKANPVAAYIFGGSERRPTEEEIMGMLVPDNRDPETILTGMDACLVMGGRYLAQYKKLAERLSTLKHSHDLYDVINTENHSALKQIGRKSRLQKGISPRILSIIVRLMTVEKELFEEICVLCTDSKLNLDFDAFVLMKLMELGDEENEELMDIIKDNVINELMDTKPVLAELLRNGPADEFTRLLSLPIDSESAGKLVDQIVKSGIWNWDDECNPPVPKSNYQLIFLLIRCLTTGDLHVAKRILEMIPVEAKKQIFPGLQRILVEKTLEFASCMIQMFLSENTVSEDWKMSESLLDSLNCVWSRIAVTQILDAFRNSISSPQIFDKFVPLNPESSIYHQDLVELVQNSLRFATWIVKNYSNLDDSKSIEQDLHFLKKSEISRYLETVKKALGHEDVEKRDSESVETMDSGIQATSSEDSVERGQQPAISRIQTLWSSNSIKIKPESLSWSEPSEKNNEREENWLEKNLEKALSPTFFSEEKREDLFVSKSLRIQTTNHQNIPIIPTKTERDFNVEVLKVDNNDNSDMKLIKITRNHYSRNSRQVSAQSSSSQVMSLRIGVNNRYEKWAEPPDKLLF
ncbi:CRE-PGL-2 protein [Caenorhabditis remanei]|uniref:CRE-PGL-2 protein n=1 Tax=Caenorhabditis remanei TaxID=31234 RepID=E3NC89_CAERE|nr:CRE-PGL-2 protein [Caenorhabditis remanei]